MIYTGYKFIDDELIIKESKNRKDLEKEDFEYIASSNRDKQYLEVLLENMRREK